jgi:hypothetical protein
MAARSIPRLPLASVPHAQPGPPQVGRCQSAHLGQPRGFAAPCPAARLGWHAVLYGEASC